MLAPFRKIGGLGRCWRLPEKQADQENVGALQKNRRIGKILAPHRKIGGFTKCQRLAEIYADDRILAGVEIPAPVEKSADPEKVGGPLTVWARRNLQLLTSSWTG